MHKFQIHSDQFKIKMKLKKEKSQDILETEALDSSFCQAPNFLILDKYHFFLSLDFIMWRHEWEKSMRNMRKCLLSLMFYPNTSNWYLQKVTAENKKHTIIEMKICHKEAHRAKKNSSILRLFLNSKGISVSISIYIHIYIYISTWREIFFIQNSQLGFTIGITSQLTKFNILV